MGFSLHPQLAKDCMPVAELPVCRVLLMNQALFPWLVLVPAREGLRELHELSEPDYAAAMAEARKTAQALQRLTGAHKMNVAALGNMVAQLHIHIIARFENDAAWPAPVWNSGVPQQPYTSEESEKFITMLRQVIS